jgi:uncharacterized membrane protein
MDDQRINLRPAMVASAVIIVMMLILSAWAWVQIPPDQKIPVHWNLSGQVDRYGGKVEGLLGMPLLVLFLVGLFATITRIEPRKMNLQRSMKAYTAIWIAGLVVLLATHIFCILSALGRKMDINSAMPVLTGLVFMVTGNYMGKIRSNFFAGCRTPWTLSSDLSWSKSNRLGGKLFVLVGAITILTGFMGNPSLWLIMISELILIGAIVYPYSYVIWKSDPNRSGATVDAEPGVDWMAPLSYMLVPLLAGAILFAGRPATSPQHPSKNAVEAQELVSNMAKGDFVSAEKNFDSTMKTVLPAEKLGQTWSQLTEQAGAFKSPTGSRETQEAGFQIVYVTCQFEKATWDIKVVIDGSGQVSGLWIVPTRFSLWGK